MASYYEKLKDPRWQKKRLEIMERDNFTCQCCGEKEKTLNVHHWKYGKNPWSIDEKYLKTYCEECHENITVLWEKFIDTTILIIGLSHKTEIDQLSELQSIIEIIVCNRSKIGIDREQSEFLLEILAQGIFLSGYNCAVKDCNNNGKT